MGLRGFPRFPTRFLSERCRVFYMIPVGMKPGMKPHVQPDIANATMPVATLSKFLSEDERVLKFFVEVVWFPIGFLSDSSKGFI